ncbi:hypothetical protein GCM10025881_30960 [Pseudolysinimonas kribbensis]|uniref:ABC transmembrane type-1 domain-containing protein n=1 Tax=Pseudolysinimonas kribbensis TaxID=433641 RepID=A0ABQ6KCC8_9MICO|nr:hypothetical protein GCM10025881_30960 [Pseudolysinimonas kribbensis]
MVSFIVRRILASLVVLFVASYLVYNLAANSSDPLADLRSSTLPTAQKHALMEQRIAALQLDIPPYLRYFIWFGGILAGFVGKFTLGDTIDGQHVTDALGSAMGATLQLVTTAFVIGLIIGVTIGIATALRIYSTFDYITTFIAFLFFSLPVFWVAVMLKQFAAINFNDFLSSPVIPPLWIGIIAVVSGVVWMGIVGGGWRRRLIVFGVAVLAPIAVLTFTNLTGWFKTPRSARSSRPRSRSGRPSSSRCSPPAGRTSAPGTRHSASRSASASRSTTPCTCCSTSSASSTSARCCCSSP